MATITVPMGEAGDGAFSVALTINDLTDRILTVETSLLRGTADIIVDGDTVFATVPPGVVSTDVRGANRNRQDRNIGFRWNP